MILSCRVLQFSSVHENSKKAQDFCGYSHCALKKDKILSRYLARKTSAPSDSRPQKYELDLQTCFLLLQSSLSTFCNAFSRGSENSKGMTFGFNLRNITTGAVNICILYLIAKWVKYKQCICGQESRCLEYQFNFLTSLVKLLSRSYNHARSRKCWLTIFRLVFLALSRKPMPRIRALRWAVSSQAKQEDVYKIVHLKVGVH